MSDERLLATFLELVRIDSPTHHEAGVARYCVDALTAAGCEVVVDATEAVTGCDTGNVIALLPGTGAGLTVAVSAHMDTVEPGCGVEPVIGEDRVIRSAGDTVLGADDKVGIAAAIEAIRRVGESGRPHPPMMAVLSVAEEIGLIGAKAMDKSTLADVDLALVLDAVDGEVGGIIVAAPTHYTFTAEFTGKASHAGVAPLEGHSAIVMAARAVCAMDLGMPDERSTANIGVIEGGVATNVVAPSVRMTGECRSLDAARVEELRESMDSAMRAAAREGGGTVDIAWNTEYLGYSVAETAATYRLVADACGDIGVTAEPCVTRGGADSNVFAEHGVPALALCCGMSGAHSQGESVAIRDLEMLTALVEAVVARAAITD